MSSSAQIADLKALLSQAVACHQAGRLTEAEQLYRKALERDPKQFDALHLLGVIHFQRGAHAEAVRQIDAALSVNPKAAMAHNSRAAALQELKRFDEAVASCDEAIALKPDYAEALTTRASALVALMRWEAALANCERAIALKPGLAEACNNRGNALRGLGRLDEALASYDRAIALKPDFAEALNNRANALNQLDRFDEALASSERAIALRPDMAEAFFNRGIAFDQTGRNEEALASYDRAIALKPDYAEAWSNRGATCLGMRRYGEGRECYRRAMALNSDLENLRGMHLHAKMLVCDWTDFAREWAQVNHAVADGKAASPPLQLLACSSDPAIQRKCADVYIQGARARTPRPLWQGERYAHSRIRLGYLSADFRNHPVALLSAGLFERHDRARFETIAISYGGDSPDPMRARLEAAFDRFIGVSALSDEEVARAVRELEIDIAVDLNGFTDGMRPGVLARRPAPVQVNYLGYAGTMGHGFWDYILADRFVVPDASRVHFAEQVVHLPDCFMVNDCGRRISTHTPSRAEAGLPENELVFCCFNNVSKITPDVFDVWMRLLGAVAGSVLWLSAVDADAIANLRREAARRGVSGDRLIFAPRVPSYEDHLARQRLADLFLDTLYYNAHASAADALWAGVPVLTCAGSTFASRVGGSLLNAVGLPELVTATLSDYEALALNLGRDPARLASLRRRLACNRDVYPLFDTDRFTRHLETAYISMWERTQRGEPPQAFAVRPES